MPLKYRAVLYDPKALLTREDKDHPGTYKILPEPSITSSDLPSVAEWASLMLRPGKASQESWVVIHELKESVLDKVAVRRVLENGDYLLGTLFSNVRLPERKP
jgi:hypothetical protein